jgi:hypothetical protein
MNRKHEYWDLGRERRQAPASNGVPSPPLPASPSIERLLGWVHELVLDDSISNLSPFCVFGGKLLTCVPPVARLLWMQRTASSQAPQLRPSGAYEWMQVEGIQGLQSRSIYPVRNRWRPALSYRRFHILNLRNFIKFERIWRNFIKFERIWCQFFINIIEYLIILD